MFQFTGLAPATYAFSDRSPGFARRGCPIRRSTDKLAFSNPWLFAECYVLHRLSVPRHPPHALTSLVKTCSTSFLRRDSRTPGGLLRFRVVFLGIARCYTCVLCYPCIQLSKIGCGRFRSREYRSPRVPAQLGTNQPAPPPYSQLVEMIGIEPTTSGLQSPRSPN
jgi:hypothetical protein